MNKTVSINLGSRNFFIEETAYQKLDAYLSSVKAHFAPYRGSAEIVSDMEDRIAEKFSEKFKNDPQAVITEKDVESLIGELGTVEDFSAEEGKGGRTQGKPEAGSLAPKRLMRNQDDKIIAGVCSGIAAYFDVDPIIIRFIFGILIFAWGSIIPIYLLLWIIMPSAKTVTEKMQMRGERLNMDSLSHTIKERAAEFKHHMSREGGDKRIGNFFRKFFSGIAEIFRVLIAAISKIVGIAIIVATGLVIAALTITLAIGINSSHLGFPFNAITHGAAYYAMLVAAYILLLVPIIFLLLSGEAIVSRRKKFNGAVYFPILAVWFLAAIVGGVLAAYYVPGYVQQIKNNPELQTVSKKFDVKDFSNLELYGRNHYKLIQADKVGVTATGPQFTMDRLEAVSNGNTLTVDTNNDPLSCIFFCFSEGANVEITAPDFEGIAAHNASLVESDLITASTTALKLLNSAQANIRFETKQLTVTLLNSSAAALTGTADLLKADIHNGSTLDAKNLLVKDAFVTAENASTAMVNVTDTLQYLSNNGSTIYYSGKPKLENTGSGRMAVPDRMGPTNTFHPGPQI